ncbi:MAG: glycoside hydrolase family 127 protein [Candidatus Hermodarchaeota archaeon]
MYFHLEKPPFNKFASVPFFKVEITDNFWSKRQDINRKISLDLQYKHLEEDFHVDNFRVAAGKLKGIQRGDFYFDSDLYKWLEGGCYFYHLNHEQKIKEKIDLLSDLIVKSQLEDGYLNTFYSTKFLEKRFTNFLIFHELYCAGHLIELAIAHYNATNSDKLLNAAKRFADLLVKKFFNGNIKDTAGHPEIELALIQLSRITKNKKYLMLAKHFIDMRGKIPHFKKYVLKRLIDMQKTIKLAHEFNQEYYTQNQITKIPKDEVAEFLENLSIKEWMHLLSENLSGKMFQLNSPVRELNEPVGHSVRATYLYSAMTDLYSETGELALLKASERIWLNMVEAKMYITGGIGSIRGTEGFEGDFKLKNEKSSTETCAAIGNIMWNWRLLQITGECKYADLIEKLLYNAFLVGQSIDGKKYFYYNHLISHGKDERQEWFICTCCPTNFIRIIPSLGQYIYNISKKGIWIHQYIGSKVVFNDENQNKVSLSLESEFPWKGNVKILIALKNDLKFNLHLRIPKWCDEVELKINGDKYQSEYTAGTYLNNDEIKLKFKIEPKLEKSDPRIKYNRGRVALSNGPLIYCLEEIDNKDFDIFEAKFSKNIEFKVSHDSNLLGGVNVIEGNLSSGKKFKAIPYYTWCNRGPNKMQVWNTIEK